MQKEQYVGKSLVTCATQLEVRSIIKNAKM